MERLYTTGDIANILQVSIVTIHTYIENGLITPDYRVGRGRRRFKESTVKKFLQDISVTDKDTV